MDTYEKKYNEALERARNFYNGLRWRRAKDELENIFPELRESEDEIHRKWILEYLYDGLRKADEQFKDHFKSAIDWLEKQKEQKPNIELIQRSWYMEGYHDREFDKEPKWIIKTGEGGPKHELNPRYGQPLAEQRPTEEQLHNLNEAIKGLRMDGCERMADSLHSLYNILKTQEQKPAEPSDEELVKHPPITYTYPSDASRDVRLKMALLALLNSDLIKVAGNKFTKQDLIDWVGRIPTDKPAEWSEEDELMRTAIIQTLERFGGRGTTGMQIDWLKDLRPSWKPSELEKGALRTAIHILTDERNFPKAAKQLQNILDAFEGKESRKDWKPSEEQLDALAYAIQLLDDGLSPKAANAGEELEHLREQLKKLLS